MIATSAKKRCPQCKGRRARILYVDPRTGKVWHSNMPFIGCGCGRPIRTLCVILSPSGGKKASGLEVIPGGVA